MTNWSNATLDLNADGVCSGAGEFSDDRTHSIANELLTRDLDASGGSGPNYTLTYSNNGELTSDGHEFEHTWDAWGRLVQVYGLIADAVVSEFEYNGLGWQKSFSEVTGGGGTNTYWNMHDHQGRTLMVRRGTDTASSNPAYKARTVYHNAGRAGSGASSYRNAVVLRDADMSNAWTGAADGTLELRHYSLQNHRGDVVAILTSAGEQVEHVRYDAYGYPTALPAGDTDSDGDFDASDVFTGSYDIRKDVNLDGSNNVFDAIAASAIHGGYVTLGRGVLSHDTKHHNRIGWQGSEHASAMPARILHTPHRHHHVVLGRWISRDPAGYIDGPSLYQYAISGPINAWDWSGLNCQEGLGCGGAGPEPISDPAPAPSCYQDCIKRCNRLYLSPGGNPKTAWYDCYYSCQGLENCHFTPGEAECDYPEGLRGCDTILPNPSYINASNGCGGWPNDPVPDKCGAFNFRSCCDGHDLCYGKCNLQGSGRCTNTRYYCDDDFIICLFDACIMANRRVDIIGRAEYFLCYYCAQAYYSAVRVFGGLFYSAAQQNACICCDPKHNAFNPTLCAVYGE